jgi:hypothetical protein
MEQSVINNPLKQYFRAIKSYIRLPSGTSYYTLDIIKFTDDGEIGIMALTGKDELILKNPDALLNGEAIIEILSSCVPSLKNPRALLTNDIDALITAIRYTTYNDTIETSLHCPKCKHENVFKLNLQYALDNMSTLEPEYVVNLESGLTVFVKPYSFPELIKSLHANFERNKLSKSLENDGLEDNLRSGILAKAFREIAVTKFELLTGGIVKIVDDANGINVSDKSFIKEFLQNIDKKSVDKISDLITEINKIGIKRTFEAKCEECKHTWENEIDFNPVNFS